MGGNFMTIYKNLLLCIMTMFSIFIFIGCEETEASISDGRADSVDEGIQQITINTEDVLTHEFIPNGSQDKASDDISEDHVLTYIADIPVYISSLEDINLDDFLNNPNLSAQENERVKKSIIDILLYVYGFDIHNKDILLAIDAEGREDLAVSYYNNNDEPIDNMTSLIHFFRETHVERIDRIRLYAVDANFMMRPYNLIEEDRLQIYVPIYDDLESYGDEGGSRKLYYFEFKKIDDAFKVIGIAIDS